MTSRSDQIRTYDRASSVVFLKTKEKWGGLSNMAGGYPLRVNGLRILTSEALYQVCRFPHKPEVQRLIIEQASPMAAKMKSKPFRKDSRPDWDQVRVRIMRWCLRVKLAQNWTKFGALLESTGDRPIVELSVKDDFWGAKPAGDATLVGRNVLGRLLMELREDARTGGQSAFGRVEPLDIPDFCLDARPIEPIVIIEPATPMVNKLPESDLPAPSATKSPVQASLFEMPSSPNDRSALAKGKRKPRR
jgi:type I restriction enzyme S subunit